jgi:hypothetical protein
VARWTSRVARRRRPRRRRRRVPTVLQSFIQFLQPVLQFLQLLMEFAQGGPLFNFGLRCSALPHERYGHPDHHLSLPTTRPGFQDHRGAARCR